MKKSIFAILAACLLLLPVFTAYADVIIEPTNGFYLRNKAECVYLGRNFSANGELGFVSVKNAPGDGGEIIKIENGETIYLEFSCFYKDEFWGLTRISGDSINPRHGWIKIDGQLLVLYDYVAFEEENLHQLYEYAGDYAELAATKSALAWPWPGADEPVWTIQDIDMEHFGVMHAYKDGQGREWGFVTYLYGSRNIWFCLSDPLNRDIPAFNQTPEPMQWVSDTEHTNIEETWLERNETSVVVVIVILVAALVAGTVILIKVFWKQEENTKGRENK